MFGMGVQETANADFYSSIHCSISLFHLSKHKNKEVSNEIESPIVKHGYCYAQSIINL